MIYCLLLLVDWDSWGRTLFGSSDWIRIWTTTYTIRVCACVCSVILYIITKRYILLFSNHNVLLIPRRTLCSHCCHDVMHSVGYQELSLFEKKLNYVSFKTIIFIWLCISIHSISQFILIFTLLVLWTM